MSDFERRLRDALHAAGDVYEPADEAGARARFLRRRRRRMVWSGGSVALAGAAAVVAFVMLPRTVEQRHPEERAVLRPGAPAVVEVGGEPVGIVHAHGAAWATDRARGTVVKIDPAGDVVARIAVSNAPDDVITAGGYVWSVDSRSRVLSKIDPAAAELVDEFPIPGHGGHLDVAGSDGALWLLEEGGALHRFDLTGNGFSAIEVDGDPTDVTVEDGDVWIYARAAGEVRRIDPATGSPSGPGALVGRADDADLASGDGAVWFYGDGDGKLVRIDAESARVSDEVSLGGTYAGITVGADAVWVVVGDGDAGGALYQVARGAVEVVGEPRPLDGRPVDVAVGAGAVWVTSADPGVVTRLGLVDSPPDDMARPAPDGSGVDIDEVVLYFSDGRDVVALLRDGTRRRVAATAAAELSPSVSPDGTSLALQRGAWNPVDGGESPVVVEVDLVTGSEREVGPGIAPSIAPDGRIGRIVPAGGGDPPGVVVTRPDGAAEERYLPAAVASGNLAWSADGTSLLFDGGYGNGHVLDVETGRIEPVVPAEVLAGSAVSAPIEDEDGVFALRTCCRRGPGDGAFETLELVRVAGRSFARIKGLDDFGLDPNASLISLTTAERLDYEADDGWKRYDERSWFVTDGVTLLLVDEDGEADRIPVEGARGVAVNPAFSD